MLNDTAKIDWRDAITRSLKLRNEPYHLFFSIILALNLLKDWGLIPK